MVGWNHGMNGHESGQTLGDSEGQGNLVCCSPWGHKESDTTEQLNRTDNVNTGCYRIVDIYIALFLSIISKQYP